MREKDWIRTYTGLKMHPFDPQVDQICIEDIAHALSMLCRYTGHTQRFFSVGEHSCYVAGIVAERLVAQGATGAATLNTIRWSLLHDAPEAYLGDLSRPVKYQPEFAIYREAEARIMDKIALKFGLSGEEPALVTAVDKEIIGTEARLLKFGESLATVDPLPAMIPSMRDARLGLDPKDAESRFLQLYKYAFGTLIAEPTFTQEDIFGRKLGRGGDA